MYISSKWIQSSNGFISNLPIIGRLFGKQWKFKVEIEKISETCTVLKVQALSRTSFSSFLHKVTKGAIGSKNIEIMALKAIEYPEIYSKELTQNTKNPITNLFQQHTKNELDNQFKHIASELNLASTPNDLQDAAFLGCVQIKNIARHLS